MRWVRRVGVGLLLLFGAVGVLGGGLLLVLDLSLSNGRTTTASVELVEHDRVDVVLPGPTSRSVQYASVWSDRGHTVGIGDQVRVQQSTTWTGLARFAEDTRIRGIGWSALASGLLLTATAVIGPRAARRGRSPGPEPLTEVAV